MTDQLTKMAGPLHGIALRHGIPDTIVDDAVQEGLIAAWGILDAGRDLTLAWYAAKQAILDIARGRSMTGNKRKPGRNGVDTHQRYGAPLLRTLPSGEEGLVVDPPDPRAADALEAAESGVLGAVRRLPPDDRALVHQIFWEGRTMAEAGRELGLSASGASSRWQKRIRPVLREALAS